MSNKIQYTKGQVLNQKTGSIFLEDIDTPKGKERLAKVKCGQCGKSYIAVIKKVKQGHVCPECGKENQKRTRIKNMYQIGMVLNEQTGSTLVAITDKRTPEGQIIIKAKCGYCGRIYEARVNKVKQGHFCPHCSGERRAIQKTVYHEGEIITTRVGTYFYFNTEFKNQKDSRYRKGLFTPVDSQGNAIGKTFPANLNSILDGKATGVGLSFGETKCYNSLIELPYSFEWQYSFNDLFSHNGYKLKFDFAIFYNNKICLIELDGEQHFKPVERFGGQMRFDECVQNDRLKDNYVSHNDNLYCIRIKYTQFKNITSRMLDTLIKGEEDVRIG